MVDLVDSLVGRSATSSPASKSAGSGGGLVGGGDPRPAGGADVSLAAAISLVEMGFSQVSSLASGLSTSQASGDAGSVGFEWTYEYGSGGGLADGAAGSVSVGRVAGVVCAVGNAPGATSDQPSLSEPGRGGPGHRGLGVGPLYQVADWVAQTVLVAMLSLPAAKFNDRLGRTLDAIYPHLETIWLEVVERALLKADIDLSVIFY